MTATIAYDKPVKNLIDQLSATGHVSHTKYKKTSVTLHHNGGRLTHEGVLKVWQTRPASAHFDVDASGAVAQYVSVNEYAWAVGNLAGNQSSISIEMADETLDPEWKVADATWQSAARLAGWLFYKVIGVRPTKSNFFYHKHWSSTACAGPYMDKIYAKVLKAAQTAYDGFTKTPPKTTTPSSSGSSTPTKKLSMAEIVKEVVALKWGSGPERRRRLLAAGYDADKVQEAVNVFLADHRKVGTKTIRQVANEVMAGEWGNDPQRSKKLKAEGYDPRNVQREVNRLINEGRRK